VVVVAVAVVSPTAPSGVQIPTCESNPK